MKILDNIRLKHNSLKFEQKQILKNGLCFAFIIPIAALLIFLILFVDETGFNTIMSIINRWIIFVIIISSFALGMSTYIVQTLSKNRLADTSILGIGSVNLLALVIMVAFLNLGSQQSIDNFNYAIPFVFITFSGLAAIAIFYLSQKDKFKINKKFILAGILINFIFSTIAASLSSLMSSTKNQIISSFSTGKIQQLSNNEFYVGLTAVVLLICIVWMFFIINKFKIVSINQYIATQLGINIKSIYKQALLISGILTGIAFTLSGNIIFLGLLAGNISYHFFKSHVRSGFIASGIFAFIILGLTYFINRNLLTKTNLNTSYLIPLMACPYFLYLLIKK